MKKIMSATIEKDLLKWVEQYTKKSSRYRNKSHFIEVALERLKKAEEKKAKQRV